MSFVNGVAKDQAAVSATFTSSLSSGQAEGKIPKLKLVKRPVYGQYKFDILKVHVMGAT